MAVRLTTRAEFIDLDLQVLVSQVISVSLWIRIQQKGFIILCSVFNQNVISDGDIFPKP